MSGEAKCPRNAPGEADAIRRKVTVEGECLAQTQSPSEEEGCFLLLLAARLPAGPREPRVTKLLFLQLIHLVFLSAYFNVITPFKESLLRNRILHPHPRFQITVVWVVSVVLK